MDGPRKILARTDQSRQESGKKQSQSQNKNGDNNKDDKKDPQRRQDAGFGIEAFSPPIAPSSSSKQGVVSLQVRTNPTSRRDGIVVADTPCAIGESRLGIGRRVRIITSKRKKHTSRINH